MSKTALRASLRLWQARASFRKERHTAAQKALDRARDEDIHPRQPLVDRRDKWSRLLEEARAMVKRREKQLAESGALKPRIVTAAQLGFTFQYIWGSKGALDSVAGHYDAGSKVNSHAGLIARARSIHAYHKSIGVGGAAYEALVAGRSIVFMNPMNRKSAAVAGQNTGLASICVPGTTGDRMDAETRQTVEWLIRNWHTTKVPRAHRLPRGARTVVRRGHKEFSGQSTACPDDYLHDYRKAWS
jgi:hypothetical protein